MLKASAAIGLFKGYQIGNGDTFVIWVFHLQFVDDRLEELDKYSSYEVNSCTFWINFEVEG
jgi:hypothetical protein